MSQDPFPTRWRHFLHQIEETQDAELSCSECFEHISDYVDLELAGQPAAERLPRLLQHLAQCRVCREEYEVLRDLAALEYKATRRRLTPGSVPSIKAPVGQRLRAGHGSIARVPASIAN
jgi:hypothetical protein